jgi:hypothetical protein
MEDPMTFEATRAQRLMELKARFEEGAAFTS